MRFLLHLVSHHICLIQKKASVPLREKFSQLFNNVAVWLIGKVVGHINEITPRRAGLVLRWLTICGYTQSDHLSGKPGNVREFETCQGNVRDNVNSQGIVREESGKIIVRENWPDWGVK